MFLTIRFLEKVPHSNHLDTIFKSTKRICLFKSNTYYFFFLFKRTSMAYIIIWMLKTFIGKFSFKYMHHLVNLVFVPISVLFYISTCRTQCSSESFHSTCPSLQSQEMLYLKNSRVWLGYPMFISLPVNIDDLAQESWNISWCEENYLSHSAGVHNNN